MCHAFWPYSVARLLLEGKVVRVLDSTAVTYFVHYRKCDFESNLTAFKIIVPFL